MLLSEVRNYLRDKRKISLLELSRHFNVTADVLRSMLSLLVQKGQVRQCTKKPACGTKCMQCSVFDTEMYEWLVE